MEAEKSSTASASSSPEEPKSAPVLTKQLSQTACLCSPTTHAGSFRCRRHRNGMRSSQSYGSALSELDNKTPPQPGPLRA